MKEYICVDDTFKRLDKDERKVFLKLISKSMHYTKADICRELAEKLYERLKVESQLIATSVLFTAADLLAEMEDEE